MMVTLNSFLVSDEFSMLTIFKMTFQQINDSVSVSTYMYYKNHKITDKSQWQLYIAQSQFHNSHSLVLYVVQKSLTYIKKEHINHRPRKINDSKNQIKSTATFLASLWSTGCYIMPFIDRLNLIGSTTGFFLLISWWPCEIFPPDFTGFIGMFWSYIPRVLSFSWLLTRL